MPITNRRRLTLALVRDLRPRATEYLIWDTELIGLCLAVLPSGRKSFRLQCRISGSQRSIKRTLGKWPLYDVHDQIVEQMRAKAVEELAIAERGADPRVSRQRKAPDGRSNLLKDVADEFLSYTTPTISKGHRTNLGTGIGRLKAAFGNKVIGEIRAEELVAFVDQFRAKPHVAKQLVVTIRGLFGWAASPRGGGRFPNALANPALLVKYDFRMPAHRTRYLRPWELAVVWEALDRLPAGMANYVGLVKFLILSGQRRGSVAKILLSHIDWHEGCLNQPAGINKDRRDHILPLVGMAAALCREHADKRALVGAPTLFGAPNFTRGRLALDRAIAEVLAEGRHGGPAGITELEPWHLHDLRHTFSTLMNKVIGAQRNNRDGGLILTPEYVERVLQHEIKMGERGTYMHHDFLVEKRATLERWEVEVARMISSNVVELFPAKAAKPIGDRTISAGGKPSA